MLIDADGSVGAVGGVHEKAIAARDAEAQVFVLPPGELSAVERDRLDVRGVEDLSRAVQLLQAARRTVPKATRQDGGTRS